MQRPGWSGRRARPAATPIVPAGRYFWRLTRDRHLVSLQPAQMHRFWRGLPLHLDGVDAVYERAIDHKIVFFKGGCPARPPPGPPCLPLHGGSPVSAPRTARSSLFTRVLTRVCLLSTYSVPPGSAVPRGQSSGSLPSCWGATGAEAANSRAPEGMCHRQQEQPGQRSWGGKCPAEHKDGNEAGVR